MLCSETTSTYHYTTYHKIENNTVQCQTQPLETFTTARGAFSKDTEGWGMGKMCSRGTLLEADGYRERGRQGRKVEMRIRAN